MGFATSITFSLYKPIYDKERNGLFNKNDDIVQFLLDNGEKY